jgi:hypothetical protein
MAKNFITGTNWIPAIVVARLGPVSYLLELEDKQLWQRHVDHIKYRGISPAVPGPDHEPESPGPDTATPERVEPESETAPEPAAPEQNSDVDEASEDLETPEPDSLDKPSQES